MVYRHSTLKRDRRTAARLEQLDEQILDVLREDNPQSVRHVFYRMTNPRLPEPVEKTDRGYRHVQDRMVKLRRAGRLPFGWVSDATRRGHHTPTYRDEAEAMPAGILRSLLRANIESLLPERALAVARVEEQSARDYLDRLARLTP